MPERIALCVVDYWTGRIRSLAKNKKGKRKDTGNRGSATAGKNHDGFVKLLRSELESISPNLAIHEQKKLVTLPGYFRPTKQWDLVVMLGQKILAAIELKSLGGPSYGNNANNRCEEAIGSGVDFRTLQREGGFGPGASPFLGYFIIVHDEENSRKARPKPPESPHFACDPAFASASYCDRMRILCERLMQEQIYHSAAVMTSPPETGKHGEFSNLTSETSFESLVIRLCAHVKAECLLGK